MALAVVLAAAAGLMAHSLWSLTRVELGLEPDHRLLVQLVPPAQGPDHALDVGPFYERVIAALEALPEVESAGSINSAPVRGGGWVMGTEIEGQDYESAADTPVRRGRSFAAAAAGGEPVAIVNETLARLHWGCEDPVGRRLRIGWASDAWLTVVGVVADVRHLGGSILRPPCTARCVRPGPCCSASGSPASRSWCTHAWSRSRRCRPSARRSATSTPARAVR